MSGDKDNAIKDIKIKIIDRSADTCRVFDNAFSGIGNVEVIYDDLGSYFAGHTGEIDCLVSSGNAFGFMSGGFDAALSDILGWSFQERVQRYIKDNLYGEQAVGTSFFMRTEIGDLSFIHTPTMRYPERIRDDMIIYQCMRSTLICAAENGVKSILMPVFGGGHGRVPAQVAAERMGEAYCQVLLRKGPAYKF